jgi:signal peptidase II
MPVLPISAAVVILDRLTKMLVQNHMTEGMSIPVIPGLMSFTYILNPGAAFGLLEHRRLFFIAMTIAVIVAVFYLRHRIAEEDATVQLGVAFFLGGAAGNLIDRIETGYVIDFFDFHFWPIFNVADIFICVGVGLIVWNIIRDEFRKTQTSK